MAASAHDHSQRVLMSRWHSLSVHALPLSSNARVLSLFPGVQAEAVDPTETNGAGIDSLAPNHRLPSEPDAVISSAAAGHADAFPIGDERYPVVCAGDDALSSVRA